MGEPVFRDSSDPADLPLFTAVPTASPGRVRSTFSMRLDPAATKDDEALQRRRPPCWSGNPPPGWVSRTVDVGEHQDGRTGRWWRGCEPRHRNG